MRHRYLDDEDEMPQSLEDFGEQIKNELREEYARQRNQERFWDEFYGAYPLLRANRHIVLAVWQENVDELMNSTPETAMQLLATKSQERVNWLEQTKFQRAEAAAMVGGPGYENISPNEQRVEVPERMGDVLNARKEARRQAARGFNMRQVPSNKPTYGRTA